MDITINQSMRQQIFSMNDIQTNKLTIQLSRILINFKQTWSWDCKYKNIFAQTESPEENQLQVFQVVVENPRISIQEMSAYTGLKKILKKNKYGFKPMFICTFQEHDQHHFHRHSFCGWIHVRNKWHLFPK